MQILGGKNIGAELVNEYKKFVSGGIASVVNYLNQLISHLSSILIFVEVDLQIRYFSELPT